MAIHGIVRSVHLLIALTVVSVASFSRAEKTTKEQSTRPFLETAALQLANTTIRQLLCRRYQIVVDNDLDECQRLHINQELSRYSHPQNERIDKQHDSIWLTRSPPTIRLGIIRLVP
jgi:hypothetical protein